MATYYVSTSGSDAADGLSEVNAWATIDKAMNEVAAGDKVWVKADGAYGETATIDTAGTSSASIIFEGYTSTPGDGGKATIDGAATRSSGIVQSLSANTLIYYTFKNFIITDHTSDGVLLTARHTVWKNCDFTDNGGRGLNCRITLLDRCTFSGNTLACVNLTGTSAQLIQAHHCLFDGVSGIEASSGNGVIAHGCQFRITGASGAINAGGLGFSPLFVSNCLIDGLNKASSSRGIVEATNAVHQAVVINTIFTRLNTAWVSGQDRGDERDISGNNIFYDNTTNFSGNVASDPIITADPEFVDIGTADYRLGPNSPARNAGVGLPLTGSQGMDIGPYQSIDSGGGGFGASWIKTGGQL